MAITIYADDTAYAPIPGLDEQLVNPAITSVSWTSPFAGQSVVCDVWFGTDETMATATKIIDGLTVTSAPVTLAATTTYYWRVDTYNPFHQRKNRRRGLELYNQCYGGSGRGFAF